MACCGKSMSPPRARAVRKTTSRPLFANRAAKSVAETRASDTPMTIASSRKAFRLPTAKV